MYSGVPVTSFPRARGRVVPLVAGAEVHQDDATAVLAHDVAGGHIAMQQPGAVHRGQRATQVRADARGLARAQRALLLDDLLQRAAADELHPDADRAVARFGAVDRDDVRMAHARQEPAFVDDARGIAQRRGRIVNGGRGAKQLERDLSIEVRIPCAIHLAKTCRGRRVRAVAGVPTAVV